MGAARVLAALAAAASLLTAAPAARAAPGLRVGASDDLFKHEPGVAWRKAAALGLDLVRVTLGWTPGQTALTPADDALLAGATAGAAGRQVVLAVYGANTSAPQDEQAREAYCAYVRSALAANPAIRDVVVWNEPNKQAFWRPQFDGAGASLAPAAYAALLARCYDVLHAFRPDVNVIGLATAPRGLDNPGGAAVISHSVGSFIRKIGEWYRSSGRTAPLLDTVGHHAYPASESERPWRRHGSQFLGEGDWDALMNALDDAFLGTAQQVPGECRDGRCVEIWYTEAGFQTVVDPAESGAYLGQENVADPLVDDAGGEPDDPRPAATSPAPDHATQLRDAIRLAACQDYVGAFLNFLLVDEVDRARWQSGLLWADRTPKDSAAAFRAAADAVDAGAIDCSALKGGPEPEAALAASGSADGTPLTAVLADVSGGGAVTSRRWDVLADGVADGGEPTLAWRAPAPGLYPVSLLVRNGVGEDRALATLGVPAAGAPGLCASLSAIVRRVEGWFGAVALPTGVTVPALRLSEAVPPEVAARVGVLAADPAFGPDLAAATVPVAAAGWSALPDEAGDPAGQLAGAFAAAAAATPGTLALRDPVPIPFETVELGSAATPRPDGATDCLVARAELALVRRDATLVPPPPVARLERARAARTPRGPGVLGRVSCRGYATQRCDGWLQVERRRGRRLVRIGRAPVSLPGGAAARVTVNLGFAALRELAKLGRLTGVVVRFASAAGGAEGSATVALRRTRPPPAPARPGAAGAGGSRGQAGAATAGSSASARSTSSSGYSKSGSRPAR